MVTALPWLLHRSLTFRILCLEVLTITEKNYTVDTEKTPRKRSPYGRKTVWWKVGNVIKVTLRSRPKPKWNDVQGMKNSVFNTVWFSPRLSLSSTCAARGFVRQTSKWAAYVAASGFANSSRAFALLLNKARDLGRGRLYTGYLKRIIHLQSVLQNWRIKSGGLFIQN